MVRDDAVVVVDPLDVVKDALRRLSQLVGVEAYRDASPDGHRDDVGR